MQNINDPYTAKRLTQMVGWVEADNDSERLKFVISLLEDESKRRYEAQQEVIKTKGKVNSLTCELEAANQYVEVVRNLRSLMQNFDYE